MGWREHNIPSNPNDAFLTAIVRAAYSKSSDIKKKKIYIHYLITQNTTSSLFYKTEIVCVCPPNMYQNVKQNYKLCIYTLEKTHCKNSKISFGFCGDSEKRYPHLFPPTVGFVSATPLRPPIFRCSVLRRDASSPALLGGSSVW